MRHIASLVLTGALAACNGSAPPAATTGIQYEELSAGNAPSSGERVAYGSSPYQFGELRLPRGRKRVPVVVLVHGGCWRAAFDLAHVSRAADALTHAGFATWTIEYRRVGDAGGGWPGTFADVAEGLDYTRELVRRFPRLDSSRVVIVGHSAGGQLALWAASRRRDEKIGGLDVARSPVKVAGVVSLAGITDLREYSLGSGSCSRSVGALMGGTPFEFPERYSAVNPFERAPIGVPIWFIHGTADTIVPLLQSQTMLEREKRDGEIVRLITVESAGHFDLVAPVSTAWKDVMRAVRALAAKK